MPFDLPLDYLLGLVAWMAAGVVCFVALLTLRRGWARHKPARMKWINAGLSLWIFFAALTVVELYFAIVYDQSDSFNMSNVSKHWFSRHVHRNSVGFRDDRPFEKTVPEGTRRIAFVGDSFTFGHGVKNVADRFSDRVGRRLEQLCPGKFVVANMGEIGWDTRMVAAAVETQVVDRERRIDVLVYTICLNDIDGFQRPEGEDQEPNPDLHDPKFFLFRDTYFLNMLYFRIEQARLPTVQNYYSHLAELYRSVAWDRMRRKLDRLREFCQEQNIDLRFVIFPFLHNLGPDYPFSEGHERIAEYCRETGRPCLDLMPVLLPHAGEGLVVNRFDAHPNERAHALAADAIARDLLGDLRP